MFKINNMMLASLIVCSSYIVAGIGASRPAQQEQVRPQDRELLKAVRENRLGEAQRLIDEEGANINAVVDGSAPIHWAAARGTSEIVQFVLRQRGVDIHIRLKSLNQLKVKEGCGPHAIHIAAFMGNKDSFQQLIDAGAELESKCTFLYDELFGLIDLVNPQIFTPMKMLNKCLKNYHDAKHQELKDILTRAIAERKLGARTKSAARK